MADKNSAEASSSSQVGDESSEATVEINVKTLDSQIFPFRVNKNMPVLTLKEKIANVIGLPVELQRLIFRGKVLKDGDLLSAYHVEDGHTIHLVARQAVQSESQLGTSSTGTGGNVDTTWNDPAAGAPWNRMGVVGQVSHNLVLGPISISDQSENIVPDVTRIIGSVLSSLGLATPTSNSGIAGSSSSGIAPNSSSHPSQTINSNTTHSTSGGTTTENQLPISTNLFPFPLFNQSQSQPFHLATFASLTTLSSFISRLEQALLLNGYQSPTPGSEGSSGSDLASSTSGSPTPELLGAVMFQAQRLVHGQAAAALSHIAGRLAREGSSTDPAVRGQIQNQAMHLGVAMQHLGAMLLELGRATLTLRMGESPAEAFVNTGPAVYISAAGPSPMMVQPVLHTTPLFGLSPNFPLASTGVPGQVRTGDALRSLNIHVHSGTPVAAGVSSVGTRTTSGEHTGHDPVGMNRNATGGSTPAQGLPSGLVVTAAAPAQSTREASRQALSAIYPIPVPRQQSNSVGNVSGPADILQTTERGSGLNVMRDGATTLSVANEQAGSSASISPTPDSLPAGDGSQSIKPDATRLVPGDPEVYPAAQIAGTSQSNLRAEEKKPVPLGLGLGGLQPKKRGKQSQSQSIAMGQQVLQSLVSQADSRRGGGSTAGLPGAQQAQGKGSQTGDSLLGLLGGQGGFDISTIFQQMIPVVSQVLGTGPGAPSPDVEAKSQAPRGDRRFPSDDQSSEDPSQIDVRSIIERLRRGEPRGDAFRDMIESAGRLYGGESDIEDLLQFLCDNEELSNEYFEMLRGAARRRGAGSGSGSGS
ncbi:unnamed protein product [Spirodela intermedia]|uniref:Ubiquitin-like domain-containing protein n=1 Tax=Spirodela intermedia TaxID=51605 RepID=A0A7I8K4J6_SPIIN|nr:unnamed protein product [Spirodela intermedia]